MSLQISSRNLRTLTELNFRATLEMSTFGHDGQLVLQAATGVGVVTTSLTVKPVNPEQVGVPSTLIYIVTNHACGSDILTAIRNGEL